MIDAQDIIELAGEWSLDPSVVEKDYVLGWLLAGISQHPELGPSWVFKGGTCLKKVFFETYRFSEDLDFTLRAETQIDRGFLRRTLGEVAEWVYRETGIEVPTDEIRVEMFQNPRGHPAAEARIYYRGPLQPRGSLPRIKLDLTADERVVLDPDHLAINHPYDDRPGAGIAVRCYPYPEVFAEKIRALGDRARPRDLYDVISLYRRENALDAAPNVREILAELSPESPLAIPAARGGGAARGGTAVRSGARRSTFGSEPRHVYECPFCRKRFRRRSADPRLRAHKDRYGQACSGRSGILVSGP